MHLLNEDDIKAVGKYLNKTTPITMRALSKKLRCSFQAARRRFDAYVAQNKLKLEEHSVRQGSRGPQSTGYTLR